jgi:hypothetical protein
VWECVSIDVLLSEVEAHRPYAMAFCDGGYSTNLPIEDLTGARAWIAYGFDGARFEPEHGGPARPVAPHLYLWKSAKWVRGFRLLDRDEPGFWESLGEAGEAPLAYVCGPTAFVAAVADALRQLGYEPTHIRTERFGPAGVIGERRGPGTGRKRRGGTAAGAAAVRDDDDANRLRRLCRGRPHRRPPRLCEWSGCGRPLPRQRRCAAFE